MTAKKISPAYKTKLVAYRTRLERLGVPVLYSLRHLCDILDLPYARLLAVVERHGDPYETFSIRKRSGGWRRIAIPAPYLLRAQRWIHQQILCSNRALGLIHPASTAYAPGCTVSENARRHIRAAWLVKIDIKDFFESISERQVFRVYKDLGYRPLVAFELTRLSTRIVIGRAGRYRRRRWRTPVHGIVEMPLHPKVAKVGHLPQGAPTSPLLANLVLRELDAKLAAKAVAMDCTYSRYADDLVFSADSFSREAALALFAQVNQMLGEYGFRVNERKFTIVPPGARKVITGLTVNDEFPRLPRSMKDQIRSDLYYWAKFGLGAHCRRRGIRSVLGFVVRLKGLLLYAKSIEPTFGDKTLSTFDKLVRETPLVSEFVSTQ